MKCKARSSVTRVNPLVESRVQNCQCEKHRMVIMEGRQEYRHYRQREQCPSQEQSHLRHELRHPTIKSPGQHPYCRGQHVSSQAEVINIAQAVEVHARADQPEREANNWQPATRRGWALVTTRKRDKIC